MTENRVLTEEEEPEVKPEDLRPDCQSVLEELQFSLKELNDAMDKMFDTIPAEDFHKTWRKITLNGFRRIRGMVGGYKSMIDYCEKITNGEYNVKEDLPKEEENNDN